MHSRYMALPLLLTLLACCQTVAAENGGVTVGGTRLIFAGDKKETSLSVSNSDTSPYLIQSWIESQANDPAKPPFIITPPLFRLEGNEQNLLRIVYIGGKLPVDRESLYWLNVKTIPASNIPDGANTLQVAIRTRIKLIYRPSTVKGIPKEVTQRLSWSHHGNKLTVTNPTAFYMNFNEVTVGNHPIAQATFVAPMSTATFDTPANISGQVSWKIISDFGGIGESHSVVR